MINNIIKSNKKSVKLNNLINTILFNKFYAYFQAFEHLKNASSLQNDLRNTF